MRQPRLLQVLQVHRQTTTSATNAIIDSRSQKFGGLVVGRRRRRLEIVIANGSIADVPASTYVLGIFQGVAPSGAAYSVDQRSKGARSRVLQQKCNHR